MSEEEAIEVLKDYIFFWTKADHSRINRMDEKGFILAAVPDLMANKCYKILSKFIPDIQNLIRQQLVIGFYHVRRTT